MKTVIQRDWLRRPAVQNRWLGWAKSVRGKQHRNATGFGFAMLHFLHAGRGAFFTSQHSSSTSNVSIYPGIHLAIRIHAGIRRFDSTRSTTLRFAQSASSGPRQQRVSQAPIHHHSQRFLRSAATLVPVFRHLPLSRASGLPVLREVPREASAVTHSVVPIPMASAILREHWTRRTTRTEEKAIELSEVVTRRQIDSPSRLSAVVPTTSPQQQPAPLANSSLSFESTHIAPWAKGSDPAPVNVQQLTDQVIRQIDSRMIAWRERMGKV